MYGSKSDHDKSRPKGEDSFMHHRDTGGVVTFRSVHQTPAPDFGGEPFTPEFLRRKVGGLPTYSTESPGFAVVVQRPEPKAPAMTSEARSLKVGNIRPARRFYR